MSVNPFFNLIAKYWLVLGTKLSVIYVTGLIFSEVCHFMFISVFSIYFVLLFLFDHV